MALLGVFRVTFLLIWASNNAIKEVHGAFWAIFAEIGRLFLVTLAVLVLMSYGSNTDRAKSEP